MIMQQTLPNTTPTPDTWPHLDEGLWSFLGTFLWLILVMFLLIKFRSELVDLFRNLVNRVKGGSSLKLFSVEFGPIRVPSALPSRNTEIAAQHDETGRWKNARSQIYQNNQNIFLAHRLFPSEIKGQLYDILIYLVPHKDRGGTLSGITHVEYYFGDAWGNQVFTSTDSGKRFAIVISAYGAGFLCFSKIYFSSGPPVETWRYIDFEMGALGEGGDAPGNTKTE